MQVVKPKRLGVIYKTYHLKYHRFAAAAVAFFPLGKENPQPLVEFDQWPKVMGQLPTGIPLDMGFAKPRGEALACAKGYYHQHGLLYTAKASLRLGKLYRKVRIPRSHKKQPQLLTDLLPLDIMDKRRSKYNGTYNDKWLKHVHPGLPDDTNPRLFNSAIEDLQISSASSPFFSPGEAYTLEDLHPQEKSICGTIPDIRTRLFVMVKDQTTKKNEFREMETVLDTVWFFPEEGIGAAIYRGTTVVQDSDGLDVTQLLMAYENNNDQPRPQHYYQNVLSLRTDIKTAVAHLFNESQLMPEKTPEELARIETLIAQEKAKKNEKAEELRKQYKQQAWDIAQQSVPAGAPGLEDIAAGLEEETSIEEEYELPVIPKELLDSGDFDLTPLMEAAEDMQDKLTKTMEEKQTELQSMASEYQEQYQDETPVKHESLEAIKRRIMTPIYNTAKDLKDSPQGNTAENPAKAAVNTIMEQLPEEAIDSLAQEHDTEPDKLADKLSEAYDTLQVMQKQARLAAPSLTMFCKLTKMAQQQGRQWIEELIANGDSLAGRDFSGFDLSGMDFSHQDLRDAMFEGCNLDRCDFTKADMEGASLVESSLNNCCFSSCQLMQTNFSNTRGSLTVFDHSCLDNSFFIKANLEYASFANTTADHFMGTEAVLLSANFQSAVIANSHFLTADLTDSVWDKAKVTASIFMQANMQRSRWVEAGIERCMLIDIQGQKINFKKAALHKVQFSNVGNLQEANLSFATCITCGFRGVDMSKLYAPYAVFVECDFADAQLNQAELKESIFKRSLMTLAQMEGSCCSDSLFNESIVRKVDFSASNLDDAEFFNCTLEKNIVNKLQKKVTSVKPQAILI